MTHANLQKIAKCDINCAAHRCCIYLKAMSPFLKFQIVHVSCRHKYVCERQFFVYVCRVVIHCLLVSYLIYIFSMMMCVCAHYSY